MTAEHRDPGDDPSIMDVDNLRARLPCGVTMVGVTSQPIFEPDPSQAARVGPSFRVVDARASGVSRRQLGGDRLVMPTFGVRSPRPMAGVAERASAYAMALPGDVVFSHLTAAQLWGLSLPWRLEGTAGPLEVMRDSKRSRIERQGVVSHRGLERRLTEQARGLPVTSIADTWCDILEKYHSRLSLADAVVVGDAAVELLARSRPLVHPDGRVHFDRAELHPAAEPGSSQWWSDPATSGIRRLVERAADRDGFRGKALVNRALPLLRPRVWSPMETRSRLVIVGGGIREPRLNVSVRDPRDVIIMIGDLVWDEERAVGGYNGPTHDLGASRAVENSQRLRLEDEGWWYLEIYKGDITSVAGQRDLIRRIRAGLGRPRR